MKILWAIRGCSYHALRSNNLRSNHLAVKQGLSRAVVMPIAVANLNPSGVDETVVLDRKEV